jgi:hypothetical protein
MWLINTQTLRLKFFLAPPSRYSILSHVWTDEECSFQEFRSLETAKGPILAITEKKGFKKIEACCKLALGQGFEWTWVDTCCIDKTSSAELSESINSMFAWYKSSSICYAYLDDVDSTSSTANKEMPVPTAKPSLIPVPVKPEYDPGSRWYYRGWTLQELLAPLHVDFYNRSWNRIGSKWALRGEIARISGIGEADLVMFDPRRSSIAQKMSWAASRNTTREEDEAYCLLGIFGIHMSLLYGEGKNAFRRLQEELIKTSTDHTIFSWNRPLPLDNTSILSPTAQNFLSCGSIVQHVWPLTLSQSQSLNSFWPEAWSQDSDMDPPDIEIPYTITNVGLEIQLSILKDREATVKALSQVTYHRPSGHVVAVINCRHFKSLDFRNQAMAIILQPQPENPSVHRVYYSPIYINTDNLEFEPKNVIITLNNRFQRLRTGELLVPREFWETTPYRAQIFVANDLPVESLRHVFFYDPPSASSGESRDSARDAAQDPTALEATAEGFYWFKPHHPNDTILLTLLISDTCTVSFDVRGFEPTFGMTRSLFCNVTTKAPGFITCSRMRPEETRNDGIWFEHELPNDQTVMATVVSISRNNSTVDMLYFGVS